MTDPTPSAPKPAPSPPPPAQKAEATLAKAETTPPLAFRSTQGLKGKLPVNTFRLGKKWADRVQIGSNVKLVAEDAEGVETPFADAEVTGVITGNWDEVKVFAADHHTYGSLTPPEAQSMLKEELERIYGSDFRDNSVLTVVYLKAA